MLTGCLQGIADTGTLSSASMAGTDGIHDIMTFISMSTAGTDVVDIIVTYHNTGCAIDVAVVDYVRARRAGSEGLTHLNS